MLLANSDLVPEAFLCPSGDLADTAVPPPPPLVFGVNCDYRYFGGGLTYSAPAGLLVGLCDPRNHGDFGTPALFADGSVRPLTTIELVDALAEAAAW